MRFYKAVAECNEQIPQLFCIVIYGVIKSYEVRVKGKDSGIIA